VGWLENSVNHDFTLYVIEKSSFSIKLVKSTPCSYIKDATWAVEALES